MLSSSMRGPPASCMAVPLLHDMVMQPACECSVYSSGAVCESLSMLLMLAPSLSWRRIMFRVMPGSHAQILTTH